MEKVRVRIHIIKYLSFVMAMANDAKAVSLCVFEKSLLSEGRKAEDSSCKYCEIDGWNLLLLLIGSSNF